jgi:hypothetical protein
MNIKRTALAITLSLSFLPMCPVVAAEKAADDEPGVQYQVDQWTCGDMLRETGDSRDFTMIYLHGFISGLKSEMVMDTVELTAATDRILDICIADPKSNLLKAFEKARG